MATMSSKRKRDMHDLPDMRTAPGIQSTSHDFSQQYLNTDDDVIDHPEQIDFAAVLAQHNADSGQRVDQHHHIDEQSDYAAKEDNDHSASDTAAAAMAQYHTMTVPQSTEQTFMQEVADTAAAEPSAGGTAHDQDQEGQNNANGDVSPTSATPGVPKPSVGSEEWHKVRRDNHKEVERRRRETINEGINELSKIVPGSDGSGKNKGSILQRAVHFITQLKENETQNIEKWTLEKLLTEQAIAELSSSCDKLKAECQRAWAECEQWKKAAQKAGVSGVGHEKETFDGDDAS